MGVGNLVTVQKFFASIIDTLNGNILGVATGAFVAGAFLYIFGGTRKETGQTMMIGAIIGYVIVKMAGFIFGIVLSFVS